MKISFLLFNYEKFEQVYPAFYGPDGSGATLEAYYVTQALVDRVELQLKAYMVLIQVLTIQNKTIFRKYVC